MEKHKVSIVRYSDNGDSIREAVELSGAFKNLKPGSKVFIKPNIVFWTSKSPFPKWGMITTSRVVHDAVKLLKDYGISDITIGEGIVTLEPDDNDTAADAFESLGYYKLQKLYGAKVHNVFRRPFKNVMLDDTSRIKINSDILESDFIINLPVLKTHAQTVVSLGIKNFKGMLDINSRKYCHSMNVDKDLDYFISRIYPAMPESATIIDGIYSMERGPVFSGTARRTNLIVASGDPVSADKVGAEILGYRVPEVRYLNLIVNEMQRKEDLTDVELLGENIQNVSSRHEFDFKYNDAGSLPIHMEIMGMKGLSYRKFDNTLCTYCSFITGAILTSIQMGWKKTPFDDVEVLSGKIMKPSRGKKKTILLGKCMHNLNSEDGNIQELISVNSCPPDPSDVAQALIKAGIDIEMSIFDRLEESAGVFMRKYRSKPEFDESFYSL